LIMTIPHRRCYFAGDDRFVNHFRRYELDEMRAMLAAVGLKVVEVRKVLGPLEKISMVLFFMLLSFFNRFQGAKKGIQPGIKRSWNGCPVVLFDWLNRLYCIPIWLDTRLTPISLSSVILIRAVR
jgi:hypothetical protein